MRNPQPICITRDNGASYADAHDDNIQSEFFLPILQCLMVLTILYVVFEIGKAVLHG